MEKPPPRFIDGPNGRLACHQRDGAGPGLFWLGGFRSDMEGAKALFVDEWAKHHKRAMARFDYSGHGQSDGVFADGAIGDWAADAIAAFDALTNGPTILIGSSMGAWIACLLARARPNAIAGAVFIAPAPDFTEALMWPSLTEDERATILAEGRLERPSDYSDEPDIFTRRLFEDGREHLVLKQPTPLSCPVVILQGMRDEAVPYAHALHFAETITGDDVKLLLTKTGDHRLSTPADLERLGCVLEALSG